MSIVKTTKDQMAELQPLLDEAKFIGTVDEATLLPLVATSLSSADLFIALKEIIREARAHLCAQFDEHATSGTLEELKHSKPEFFAKLWRAKFLKSPS